MRIDKSKLTKHSQLFLRSILARNPEWIRFCHVVESDSNAEQFELRVEIPSPTGGPRRTLVLFLASEQPSISFGYWHDHVSVILDNETESQEIDLIEAAELILKTDIVCFYEVGANPPFGGILDIRCKDAVLEELTNPYSSGCLDILSWDGTKDQRASIDPNP